MDKIIYIILTTLKVCRITTQQNTFKSRSYSLLFILFVITPFSITSVNAEIYKYQDDHGKWHFSDRPTKGKTTTVTAVASTNSSESLVDINSELVKQFKPSTPIEKATLSTVSIETSMIKGSGFFISDEGHIITNKHVVRPAETKQWKELHDRVESRENAYKDAVVILRKKGASIGKMRKQLKEYERSIERENSSVQRARLKREYKSLKIKYEKDSYEYQKTKENFEDQRKEFYDARSEFNRKSGLSMYATSFDVFTKDETKLSARLIELSKDHDLALLKLDGYKTPFLVKQDKPAVFQGMKVFAVGNPYGMRDSVTSGIITRIDDDYIVTDTQILPGNSGGPLIDESGHILGVNTAKAAEHVSAEGFGLSLPIDLILKEFNVYLSIESTTESDNKP